MSFEGAVSHEDELDVRSDWAEALLAHFLGC